MSSGITLSAGVRQNLLSLQQTASLMSTTQNRLATGKKVNSALDNPSNFFTSSSLSDRAGDLNSLLDSIGQATKTLDAASNGISSLTKLVQSAKSSAQQARQATGAVETYSSVTSSANVFTASEKETVSTTTGTSANLEATAISLSSKAVTETVGTTTGSVDLSSAISSGAGTAQITVSTGGVNKTFNVAIAGTEDYAAAKAKFDATTSGTAGDTLDKYVTVSEDAGHHMVLTAKTADVDFGVTAGGSGSTAATLTALGLTAGAQASSSLLDQVGGTNAIGKSLVISGTNADGANFTAATITFGHDAGQVSTLDELRTTVAGLNNPGFTASVSGIAGSLTGTLSISKSAGAKSSVTVGGDLTVLATASSTLETSAGALFKTQNSAPTLLNQDATLTSGGALNFEVNGQTYSVGISASDRIDDVMTKLSTSSLGGKLDVTRVTDSSNHDHLKISAKDASVDFTVVANKTSAALGLTADASTNNVQNSTSLLDIMDTKFGTSAGSGISKGKTLTVAANGGVAQTITFGTEKGQVQTVAQLNTKLSEIGNTTSSINDAGALSIAVASGSSQTSLEIGGTAAAKLGLTAGKQEGVVTSTTASTVRQNYQNDFNNVLGQIDALAKDASYNGINLLNGDDLKVTFNENGSSSLNIKGVKFDANNLGLNELKGTQFQDNDQIDTVLSQIDTALSTLRSQGSKFGSNLQTVQTRQEFTTDMVNTLQQGSDALVLADTNLEGANMLALQTRQQLSTTALSMANQSNQAVLRLF
jgi:flagellin-like hook-associated protein FlgL